MVSLRVRMPKEQDLNANARLACLSRLSRVYAWWLSLGVVG